MEKSSATQIILAIIALVGALGAALLSNWDKFNSKTETSTTPAEQTPANDVTQNSAISLKKNPQVSTTCRYTSGPKTGTIEFFPLNTPGLTPGLVGYPCTDGVSSNGLGIPNR